MWTEAQIQERINQAVDWLRLRAREAGAAGLVVGISGGVDSAVVAGLCRRAFPDHCLGVIMPCHSDPADRADARLVAENHGIKVVEIDLGEAHTGILRQVETALAGAGSTAEAAKMSQGNLKARLRMATLYAIANALNYLVVGTDNAPESYTGYFTKYGDGGVDLLPLSSLTKTEVRLWARAMGLPEKIASRVPTAGLWPGQTDEGEMGITYEVIDRFLLGEQVSEAARATIEALHQRSEHKRHLPPALELPKPEKLD